MQALLISFVVLVMLRLLVEHNHPGGPLQKLRLAIRSELRAWMLIPIIFIGACALLVAFAALVGPIPQVHEW